MSMTYYVLNVNSIIVGTTVRTARGAFVHGRSDARKGQSRAVHTSRTVIIYYDRGLRPPATRAPELASSFLTTRVGVFQHTPSSEASEGSRALPASRHSALPQSQHPSTCGNLHQLLGSASTSRLQVRCSRRAVRRFGGSAVLSASSSGALDERFGGALGERFGFGGSTMLSASNSAVRQFGGSTFNGGVRSGPRQGSAIVRGRSRWLRPHPGGWFSSDGGGNCLRRKSDQQSVDSDGMRAGSGNAASGGLQAAPRALLVIIYYDRGLRPPATRAPELASSFLTTRVGVFQQ
ncbi:predicted protein [Postia placenta Mad-698-R]|nr:predicted protein [Postia placenta Mad-698-R]